MSIKVYCDAGSNLYPEILKAKSLDINVLSMDVSLGEKTYHLYHDDVNVKEFSKEFFNTLKSNKDSVRTSLVSPGDFLDAFKKEVEAGNQVICFTMAKGISGTYNSAVLAATEVNGEVGKEAVHVVDSATAGFGEGLQAIAAYENVKAGKSFEEVCKAADELVFKVRSEFTVDDVTYLVATGRISKTVAKIANLLRIKVMLKGNNESKIEVVTKVHGRKMALKNLSKTLQAKIKDPKNQTVYITHCVAEEEALALKKELNAAGIPNIEVYPYDLVTGAHVGPGCIAIFYIGENRD